MQILETLAVKVCYLSRGPFELELVVVSGDGPCLMSRDWLQVIHLDCPSMAVVSQRASARAVQAVLDNCQDVFTDGLGTIYPFKATLLSKMPNLSSIGLNLFFSLHTTDSNLKAIVDALPPRNTQEL